MIRSPIYSTAWRATVAFLTVEIAIVSSLRYFAGSQEAPPPILANAFANPFLVLHVAGGVAALLAGPLQFVKRVRTRWPAFHRTTGRIYVAGCAIGAPTGFVLALGSTAGPMTGAAFALQAVLWGLFTWLGVRAIMDRRIGDHREWMLRSYAVTSAAITLRLMLPASAYLGFDFLPAYQVIAWLAPFTNIILFEYYIRRERNAAPAYGRLANA